MPEGWSCVAVASSHGRQFYVQTTPVGLATFSTEYGKRFNETTSSFKKWRPFKKAVPLKYCAFTQGVESEKDKGIYLLLHFGLKW